MALEKKLNMVYIALNVVVLLLAATNLLNGSEYNYVLGDFMIFFLGLSMAIQGVLERIRQDKKWLMFLSFGAAAFCLLVSLTVLFT